MKRSPLSQSFDPDLMQAACLRWLEAQKEEDYPVLFLSGGEISKDARFHLLARKPQMRLRSRGELLGSRSSIEVLDADGALQEEISVEGLPSLLKQWDGAQGLGLLPQPPCFFGWIGYDYAWANEYGLPRRIPRGGSAIPEIHLACYDEVLILDRKEAVLYGSPEACHEFCAFAGQEALPRQAPKLLSTPQSDFSQDSYLQAVARIRRHCLEGDLFQADLSRRIQCKVDGRPAQLFSRLAGASPAPFSAFLSVGPQQAVLSASPEEYLRFQGKEVFSSPIKGTEPRGRDPLADARLRSRLLQSEKDLAELGMIVDLMRNDLGRYAMAGSVEVRGFPSLMELSHVFHLFAEVRAEREVDVSPWEVLLGAFPPGSIVGAPKPKALEVLEGLEQSRRGVYTGSIGWMDASLQGRWNVAIRTLTFDQGELCFGVGGGITALSDPQAEWDETVNKAQGFARMLGWNKVL